MRISELLLTFTCLLVLTPMVRPADADEWEYDHVLDSDWIKEELEEHAMDLVERSRLLDDNADEAESLLRDALAIAPWVPEIHQRLADHLMVHHTQKHQIDEILHHHRQSLLLDDHDHTQFPPETEVYPSRLKHDRDQIALLGRRGKLPQDVVDHLVEEFDEFLATIPEKEMNELVDDPQTPNIYGLNMPELEPLKGPALNPNLDFSAIEEQYLSSDPQFAVLDGLLTDEALLKLRTYYEEATVFWDSTGPGYLGSYLNDGGFCNPVISQLIQELITAFPRIICSHRLKTAWAYKYDSEIKDPIATHADEAAVNFNFWVSPNEGNLDPESGGLTVFKVAPPEGTPRDIYNQFPLHEKVHEILQASNYANYTIPFKTNRAVIFQSNLFHESGKMTWAEGYTKRRLNLTFLFGEMYGKCDPDSAVYQQQAHPPESDYSKDEELRCDASISCWPTPQ